MASLWLTDSQLIFLLLTGEFKTGLERSQPGGQRLPRVVYWQQQNPVAKAFNQHLCANKAVLLGQANGLAEMAEFEAALLRSIEEAARGEGRVTTQEQIIARRAGRPAGTVKAVPKISTTIRLSADVVHAFRSAGDGWQTRMDAALKDWLLTHSPV